jgi:Uncharacterized protein conserved in bacteria
MLHEQGTIDKFCLAMREKDIDVSPQDIIADGKIHRAHVQGDRRGSRNCWFVLHNDSSPVGQFGCNKRYGNDTKFTWVAEKSVKPMSADERKCLRQKQSRKRREHEEAQRAEHAAAAIRANQIWDSAAEAMDHPYLTRKGVKSYGLRVGTWERINTETGEIRMITKLALLIPIRDAKKNIHSLQAIFPNDKNPLNRGKDYLAHGEKRGMFYSIGQPLFVNDKKVILICEGYATGASLHEATEHAVIVAFDATNLITVAQIIRDKFPAATIIIAADNDRWTLKPIENPGITRAREAAEAINGLVVIPDFEDLTDSPTDFNDLFLREGSEVVRLHIEAAIARSRPERVVLVPTLEEALGVAHASECLLELGNAIRRQATSSNTRFLAEIQRALFIPYEADIQRAAELARAVYPDVALAILSAPGDEAKAQRVALIHGAALDLPTGEDSWKGWGVHFLDLLFSHIDGQVDANPAVRELFDQESAMESSDPEDDTVRGENPFSNNLHFRVLGVDGDKYFFLRKGRRNQLLTISTSGLSKNALMSLAPLNWWEGHMLGKFDKDAAVGFLMEAAETSGIFDPTFTRGRGAWWDGEKLVVHLGDRLLIDGAIKDLGAIRSDFLYRGGRKIAAPFHVPLSATDGEWLLELAKSFRWVKPVSAPLLCGWLLLSPLCGALKWRPHAWITGGAGSGKTTILNEFVRPLIPVGMDMFANGDSTEAGLRQALHSDARPILVDESESDTETAARKMKGILLMIRQSSSDTGAQTYRGTVSGDAQTFQVRSMALLSSIGVALERQQDLERVTVLALRPKREGEATDVQSWPTIRAELNKIAKDKSLSARLFRRSINMAPVVMEAIDVFTEAAAKFFGTAREGDQIGALLAGAWCLTNDRLATPDEALAEINRYDWGDHQEGKAEEQEDLVATLMGRPITCHGGIRTSVGKLVARAADRSVEELQIDKSAANSELHIFGMKVSGEWLFVHPKNPELEKLMRETKFASDLRGRLRRIDGTDTGSGGGLRIGEVSTNGLRIPLRALLKHRHENEDVEPF